MTPQMMTLDPILDAPLSVQIHLVFALPALLVGPFALFRQRRDRLHKALGYVFVLTLFGLAVSGLFIRSGAPVVLHFGPIHLLSLFTLHGLAGGLWAIRKGDIAAHRETMRSLWFGAMGLAGLFTLVPGRTMHAVLIEPLGWPAWPLIGAGVVALAVIWRRWQPLPRRA